MTMEEWNADSARSIGVRLAGDSIDEMDELGQRIEGDTLLILLNANHDSVPFVLPAHKKETRWVLLLDTYKQNDENGTQIMRGGRVYTLQGRSLAVFRQTTGKQNEQNE